MSSRQQATGDEGRDLGDADGGGLKLWETKYQFRKDMLPMFVGEAFGKKVNFLISISKH